jgi:hypothetical protein
MPNARDPRDMNLKPELDKAMGRGEPAHDAHKGSDADSTVHKSVDPDPDGGPEHNPQHVHDIVRGLKGLLGINHTPVMGEANPSNRDTLKAAGVGDALNKGIVDGVDASNEY